MLATLGGQTGLNLAVSAAEAGIFDRYDAQLIGTRIETIKTAEDRDLFKQLLIRIGEPVPSSITATTIDEAVDFMSTKASLSPGTARAEVLRYCAMPTQASSYLTGALEIARMRQRWLDEDRGSLRDFHDLAAGSGRLPIGLVERALFG